MAEAFAGSGAGTFALSVMSSSRILGRFVSESTFSATMLDEQPIVTKSDKITQKTSLRDIANIPHSPVMATINRARNLPGLSRSPAGLKTRLCLRVLMPVGK